MAEENHGSVYYPQGAVRLRLRLEDFGDKRLGLAGKNFEIYCIPKRISATINDYTSADTFSLELDYDSFPFDPRSIRACGIVIHIEDMQALTDPDGQIRKISMTKENMIFVGFADEEKISFDDDSRTVSLEGRDFTAILIDRKFIDGHISLEQPLDKVLRSILSKIEETKDLEIEFRGIKSFPILANFFSDKSQLSGRKNVKKEQNYWEVIQQIVADAGLIAYFELDKLVVTKPRTLFDKSKAKRFVYGKNLKSLEFSRKIGRKKGFNIIVRCYSPELKEVLEVKIPKEASEAWSEETGISNTEVMLPKVKPNVTTKADGTTAGQDENEPAPYIAFRVSNVHNKKQLIEIGQNIYEEMSRQELSGSFKTKEMAIQFSDANGKRTIFNILKLRVGTPLDIAVDIKDKEAISSIKTVSGIQNYLIENKYDKRVARSLAESLAAAQSFFYTKSVEFTLDRSNGFEASVEFINFIEVKA